MAKKKSGNNSQPNLSQAIASAGAVLSKKEAKSIAQDTGKTVAQVFAKAIDKGVGIGSGAVNAYNNGELGPNSSNTFSFGDLTVAPGFNQATAQAIQALAPLQNLQMAKGTAYYGASQYETPATSTRTRNGGYSSTPGSTTYNPIVLPRNGAGQGGAGGGKKGDGNQNDPFQDLRDQIDAAQQVISDLQNQEVAPYPDIEQMLGDQQAMFAAQAAQQQQALQELMIQQQQAYETQMADARRQQESMAAQAAEAQRQAMAVANAYVPGLEPSATAPAFGDARNGTRSSAANTLSNLSILTGMGVSGGVTATTAAASPLAGLQIA